MIGARGQYAPQDPQLQSVCSMASCVASLRRGQAVHWLLICDVEPRLRRHLLYADLGPSWMAGHANCPASAVWSRQPSIYLSVLVNMLSFTGCQLDVFCIS